MRQEDRRRDRERANTSARSATTSNSGSAATTTSDCGAASPHRALGAATGHPHRRRVAAVLARRTDSDSTGPDSTRAGCTGAAYGPVEARRGPRHPAFAAAGPSPGNASAVYCVNISRSGNHAAAAANDHAAAAANDHASDAADRSCASASGGLCANRRACRDRPPTCAGIDQADTDDNAVSCTRHSSPPGTFRRAAAGCGAVHANPTAGAID